MKRARGADDRRPSFTGILWWGLALVGGALGVLALLMERPFTLVPLVLLGGLLAFVIASARREQQAYAEDQRARRARREQLASEGPHPADAPRSHALPQRRVPWAAVAGLALLATAVYLLLPALWGAHVPLAAFCVVLVFLMWRERRDMALSDQDRAARRRHRRLEQAS